MVIGEGVAAEGRRGEGGDDKGTSRECGTELMRLREGPGEGRLSGEEGREGEEGEEGNGGGGSSSVGSFTGTRVTRAGAVGAAKI